MAKTNKQKRTVPTARRNADFGVPKFKFANQSKPSSVPALAALAMHDHTEAGPSTFTLAPIDSSLTRDSSSKAFMRELRKVIERSDVIIQVLDARDPEGTRSRWVEEEVRKRESEGKKLLGVVNKIDLVPRANLEAWLKHLRHSFPCMPFKSSTQSQRNNLSQNAVPIVQSATPGQATQYTPLPQTSSSLGAPALLHLLKQYSLSTPHSSLTVGVVGYPNVGKSSLINSLKRSRACAVAAMPGKTRVTQEVVLDKGVKIVDCPGVVLEDLARDMDGDAGRQKQAEIMLRNCIKAELVDDPIAPVEVILSKADPLLLQKLYSIPPYDDVRDFLIKIALTRGRLGKGGVPDLEGSAVSVLRDWNTGKIPYFTTPPAVHPSSAPQAMPTDDVEMGDQVGDAKILNKLSEAFTLDGLFDTLGDEAEFDGPDQIQDAPEPPRPAKPPHEVKPPVHMLDSDESDGEELDDNFPTRGPTFDSFRTIPTPSAPASSSRLFTREEIAVLPPTLLDRQKLNKQAKKAKKRKAAAQRTEGELMYGLMGMGVEEQAPIAEFDENALREKPGKRLKKDQKRRPQPAAMEIDEEAKKEADFAKFLANVGADSDGEL